MLVVYVTMSIHKLTAGSGYDYLTRQVAALDATDKGHTGLATYYTEKGETPGQWIGSGVAGLVAAGAFSTRPPVFVGGTGLYFRALCGGLSQMPPVPGEVREHWRARLRAEGPEAMHRQLLARDPAAASTMRVLITGASGFAGRWLCRACVAGGDEVTGVSRSGAVPDGCDGVALDLTDGAAISRAIESSRPQVVYHLAALSSVGRCSFLRIGVLTSRRGASSKEYAPLIVGVIQYILHRATEPLLGRRRRTMPGRRWRGSFPRRRAASVAESCAPP